MTLFVTPEHSFPTRLLLFSDMALSGKSAKSPAKTIGGFSNATFYKGKAGILAYPLNQSRKVRILPLAPRPLIFRVE
jgi:hypothetical protein